MLKPVESSWKTILSRSARIFCAGLVMGDTTSGWWAGGRWFGGGGGIRVEDSSSRSTVRTVEQASIRSSGSTEAGRPVTKLLPLVTILPAVRSHS